MAYTRKTPKVVEQVQKPVIDIDIAEKFVEAGKETESFLCDISRGGELPSVQKLTACVHAVGGVLHEQLMEMAQKPEHHEIIVDGTIKIFKSIAEQRLEYVPAEYDKKEGLTPAYVVLTDTSSASRKECTVEESEVIIRRSAICYGLVSGMARAAGEAMKEENEK